MKPRPPPSPLDLEIRIFQRQEEGYPVEITCPGEQEFPPGFLSSGPLPWVPRASPADEGEAIFQWLFAAAPLRSAWAEVRGRNPRRRIRLRLDAPELQGIPWELLRDAEGPGYLAASSATPFSRYLAGPWKPGELVFERPIRMLAAIAAPQDLAEYGQAPLDAETEGRALESAVAEAGAGLIELKTLQGPVSLEALKDELDKGYHVFHLVAHGIYDRQADEGGLFLANHENRVDRVLGHRLTEVVGRQGDTLRLVFLASCESGASSSDAFRGLAPQLVRAGVPAVLAMQERVAVETARTFAATFYRRLQEHGEVDRAANQARAAVLTAELPGAAVPVLFMRMRSGRLFGQTVVPEPLPVTASLATREPVPPGQRPTPKLPSVGQHLLHYRIVGKLGEGGMAQVYVAEDTKLHRRVALKLLPPERAADGQYLRRFRREARFAAALNHPNIVTLHSVEEDGGVHFLTMEWVQGKTLAELIPPGGLELDTLIEIARPLVEALVAAHEGGIIHRDLKPGNVMVREDGGVKVLDFGVAKPSSVDFDETRTLTRHGAVVGTLPYMSPEQLQGQAIDARSDLFSLGILLYEMAAGRRPFQGESSPSLILAILQDSPPRLSDLRPSVPAALVRVIETCLKKDPEQRYATASELRSDLNPLLFETDTQETVAAAPPLTGRRSRRHTVGREAERGELRRDEALLDEVSSSDPEPGMVGREAELSRLESCLDTAAHTGERQVVLITGDAGIGKTTLLRTFVARARKEPRVRIARGQCLELYGSGEAYMPVLEALNRLAREDRRRFVPLLAQYAPAWLVHMPGLLSDAELHSARSRASGSAPEHMLREIAAVLEAMSADQPLVLVLEDLHWSDDSTLDLVSALARRRESARFVLIATFRPTEALTGAPALKKLWQDLLLQELAFELPLQGLGAAAVEEYLRHRLGTDVSPALVELVQRLTDGNPLFFLNTTEHLLDRGRLVETEGRWRLKEDGGEGEKEVPDSLDGMIQGQVETLGEAEQRLLEVASVAGVEFSTAVLAAGLEGQAEEVEETCLSLARRRQFLKAAGEEEWPDGTLSECYEFKHALYQRALYRRLSRTRRGRLHGRIGERLEAGYGDRVDELAPLLAVHFHNARDRPRAVKYYGLAAKKAFLKSAPQEAVQHLKRALEQLETLPEGRPRDLQELELQMALGQAHTLAHGSGPDDVKRPFVRAQELSQRLGESRRLFRSVQGVWVSHYARGELRRALELAQQLVALAQEQEPGFQAEADYAVGLICFSLGDLILARHHLEKAMSSQRRGRALEALPQSAPHERSMFSADSSLAFYGVILWYLGYPDQALRKNQECMKLQETLNLGREQPLPSLGLALFWSAWLHRMRGEPEATARRIHELLSLSDEQATVLKEGARVMLGWASAQNRGKEAAGAAPCEVTSTGTQVSAPSGDGDGTGEALEAMHRALEDYLGPGRQIGQTSYLSLLAQVYAGRGRIDTAQELLDQAFAAVEETGEAVAEAELHRLRGEFALTCSNPEEPRRAALQAEAEGCFRRALEICRRRESKSFELRAATSLARLWYRQGERQKAWQFLQEVYSWFDEGFDTQDLKDAKSLLDECSPSSPP